jgi:hypothetical protein
MRKSLFHFFTISLMLGMFLFGSAMPVSAQGTQPWSGVCTDNGRPDGVATIQGLQCLIGNVLQIGVTGIGLAGFVMLIVGSFRYLLSGGNAKGVDEGRKTITYAVIGLVVAISAYFILRLVADFTGVQSILNFRIPGPTGTVPTP